MVNGAYFHPSDSSASQLQGDADITHPRLCETFIRPWYQSICAVNARSPEFSGFAENTLEICGVTYS